MKKILSILLFGSLLLISCGTKDSDKKQQTKQKMKQQMATKAEQTKSIEKLKTEVEEVAKEVDDLLREINNM